MAHKTKAVLSHQSLTPKCCGRCTWSNQSWYLAKSAAAEEKPEKSEGIVKGTLYMTTVKFGQLSDKTCHLARAQSGDVSFRMSALQEEAWASRRSAVGLLLVTLLCFRMIQPGYLVCNHRDRFCLLKQQKNLLEKCGVLYKVEGIAEGTRLTLGV